MLLISKVLLGIVGTLATGGLLGAAYKYSSDQFNDDSESSSWLRSLPEHGRGRDGFLPVPDLTLRALDEKFTEGGSPNVSGSSGVEGEANRLQRQLQEPLNNVNGQIPQIRVPGR
ncbi:hypothetical protein [Mycoplasma suis]|uniref:Uncharacterized protein n=2 Tax=Mycoplasma suis TaxID=57372 RepID=F0QQP7_MYCSL|nr:hypothetical protein [Mycoplasma suis]ADX97817.1 hypothetical protein MSU_0273 [Mycoplasma suis str. Illinois]CBZ40316.1 hypothetical protein MSUIS_02230 [Mycoplasma suis KI3806]